METEAALMGIILDPDFFSINPTALIAAAIGASIVLGAAKLRKLRRSGRAMPHTSLTESSAIASSDPAGATTFQSTPGGVLTLEVGVITGELEIRLQDPAILGLQIRYTGTTEWFTVAGNADGLPDDSKQARLEVLRILTQDPGVDEDGNPIPTKMPS